MRADIRNEGRIARGLAVLVLTAALGTGCATTSGSPSTTHQGEAAASELGLGVGSALGSFFYTPVKLTYALVGSIVGGIAWLYSGGNADVADGVFVPATYGDYVVTPEHLRGNEPLEFFGSRASYAAAATDRGLPPVSAAGFSESCDQLRRLPTIQFEFGRAELSRSAEATVDFVARRLRECPDLNAQIEAHADWIGSTGGNQTLSERRAQTVRSELIERGIDAARLDWAGYGETRPIARNTTAEGRALNRRVELPVR